MEDGKSRMSMPKKPEIDLGLAVLQAVFPAARLPLPVIAAACGCTMQNISPIERRALKRIYNIFRERGLLGEFQTMMTGASLCHRT